MTLRQKAPGIVDALEIGGEDIAEQMQVVVPEVVERIGAVDAHRDDVQLMTAVGGAGGVGVPRTVINLSRVSSERRGLAVVELSDGGEDEVRLVDDHVHHHDESDAEDSHSIAKVFHVRVFGTAAASPHRESNAPATVGYLTVAPNRPQTTVSASCRPRAVW